MLGWLWNVAGITLPGEAQGKTRGGGVGGVDVDVDHWVVLVLEEIEDAQK